MPTFFARRYARGLAAVSRTEQVLGIFILLVVGGILTAFVVHARATESPANANPFPEPGVEGWRAPERVERFSADELYEKIDGRADAYLQLGVVALTFGTYLAATDPERTIDVYWYDIGQSTSAEHAYRAEEAPGATPVPVGRAAYQVDGAVFFWKGGSYVQVLPSRVDEVDARVALTIAERLAERIQP